MEYRTLPGTDLVLSRIVLGCEPLGGTDWGPVDVDQVAGAVHRALDLGITAFDTSDVYGLGLSETRLVDALGTRRQDVVIVTKFGVNWVQAESGRRVKTFRDSSPKRVVEALEASLKRLRVDVVPLYLVHMPDPNTPIADTVGALEKCRQAGKIRYFGVSNFTPAQIAEAGATARLSAVELQYSLIDRHAEAELLPVSQKLRVGVLAYGALAQGLLTGKYQSAARFGSSDRRHRLAHLSAAGISRYGQLVRRLGEIASGYNRTCAQTALRWVLDNEGVTCVVAGAKSVSQVEDNAATVDWKLRRDDHDALTRASNGD